VIYKVPIQWPTDVWPGKIMEFSMPAGSRLSGRTGTATAPPGVRAGDTAYVLISNTDDLRAHQLAAEKLKAHLRSKRLETGWDEVFLEHLGLKTVLQLQEHSAEELRTLLRQAGQSKTADAVVQALKQGVPGGAASGA
jgi:hypothetical protein